MEEQPGTGTPRIERRAENEATVLRRLVELMLESQNEQARRDGRERFWKNIRWFAVAGSFILLAIINLVTMNKLTGLGKISVPMEGDYVAEVRIDGMIAPGKPASAKKLIPILEEAFADEDAKGVLLVVNSPGGTPVQASIVNHAITRLKKENPDKKVVAVAEDLMASGAYYIAVAADAIYANENSIVGSIGVKIETYGMTDLALKLGVERRIFTAGDKKVRLDMFEPVKPEDKQKFDGTLRRLHENFIATVREGRGERLRVDKHEELFSGDFWTAKEAVATGLIDGIATPKGVLKQVFDVTQTRDYSPQPTLVDRLIHATLEPLGLEMAANTPLPSYTF